MKNLLFIFLLLVAASNTSNAWTPEKNNATAPDAISSSKKITLTLKDKAMYLGAYARQNGYDTTICFVANMNPASGAFRFFIYDMVRKQFIDSGLVAHGRCNEAFLKGRRYSNDMGCGCTSLGKYKIGEKYNGKWGASYRLYGLDATNSNAYARNVVLHGHSSIPDKEVMCPLFQSDGCVTVSPKYFNQVSGMIDKSGLPVLMEIYDSYELQ